MFATEFIMRYTTLLSLIAALALTLACRSAPDAGANAPDEPEATAAPESQDQTQPARNAREAISTTPEELAPEGMGIATFAGGCFWCMEYPFEAIPGVTEVYSGYTAGEKPNPTYKEVARGLTKHTEAVRVVYDPNKVDYSLLLDVFWRNINPTQRDGQFVDRGRQYRTGIYYHDDAQRKAIEASLESIRPRFDKPIATEILEAGEFYAAEDYHQDFYRKSKAHYQRYRKNSGRDAYLDKVWGDEAGGYSLHEGTRK